MPFGKLLIKETVQDSHYNCLLECSVKAYIFNYVPLFYSKAILKYLLCFSHFTTCLWKKLLINEKTLFNVFLLIECNQQSEFNWSTSTVSWFSFFVRQVSHLSLVAQETTSNTGLWINYCTSLRLVFLSIKWVKLYHNNIRSENLTKSFRRVFFYYIPVKNNRYQIKLFNIRDLSYTFKLNPNNPYF